jgi:hypothetical protein
LTEFTGNIVESALPAIRHAGRRININRFLTKAGVWVIGTSVWLHTTITFPEISPPPDETMTIISQPQPQTDCYGNHVEFSVTVDGTTGTVFYQWQQKSPGGNFSDIIGENSSLLSIDNIGVNGQNVNGTEYRVLITDETCTLISDPALLSINSITSLTPVVVNSTICSGGSIVYSVFTEGEVSNNGYQWAWNNGSGWTFLSDGGAYSGTTTAQLTISNATTGQSGSYRVSVIFNTLNQPSGDPTCVETSFTRERNLVVREPLLPPVASGNQQICPGAVPFILTATPASGGSGSGYIYQWQSSHYGAVWNDLTGANGLSYTPSPLLSTTYYRISATDTGTLHCGTVYSEPVLITVLSLPATSSIYHR